MNPPELPGDGRDPPKLPSSGITPPPSYKKELELGGPRHPPPQLSSDESPKIKKQRLPSSSSAVQPHRTPPSTTITLQQRRPRVIFEDPDEVIHVCTQAEFKKVVQALTGYDGKGNGNDNTRKRTRTDDVSSPEANLATTEKKGSFPDILPLPPPPVPTTLPPQAASSEYFLFSNSVRSANSVSRPSLSSVLYPSVSEKMAFNNNFFMTPQTTPFRNYATSPHNFSESFRQVTPQTAPFGVSSANSFSMPSLSSVLYPTVTQKIALNNNFLMTPQTAPFSVSSTNSFSMPSLSSVLYPTVTQTTPFSNYSTSPHPRSGYFQQVAPQTVPFSGSAFSSGLYPSVRQKLPLNNNNNIFLASSQTAPFNNNFLASSQTTPFSSYTTPSHSSAELFQQVAPETTPFSDSSANSSFLGSTQSGDFAQMTETVPFGNEAFNSENSFLGSTQLGNFPVLPRTVPFSIDELWQESSVMASPSSGIFTTVPFRNEFGSPSSFLAGPSGFNSGATVSSSSSNDAVLAPPAATVSSSTATVSSSDAIPVPGATVSSPFDDAMEFPPWSPIDWYNLFE
ncbi:hypothetical protein RIF29_11041 [Crotalaria pallida]|uniref:VQ domain-containing protein n=1 Tax=Crotalaria pallida TaxID=3830 RepID=A0AAN9FTE5_CROPI